MNTCIHHSKLGIMNADEIRVQMENMCAHAKRVHTEVADTTQFTYANVAGKLSDLENTVCAVCDHWRLHSLTCTDTSVRNAATAAIATLQALQTSMRKHPHIQRSLQLSDWPYSNEHLDDLQRRVRCAVGYKYSTMDWNRKLLQQHKNFCGEFRSNLRATSELRFSRAELSGVPEDFLQSLRCETSDVNMIVLHTRPQHLQTVLIHADDTNTRKTMYLACGNHARDNLWVLASLCYTRSCMRYENMFVRDTLIIGTDVKKFLDMLYDKLRVVYERDIRCLQQRCNDLQIWDLRYYEHKLLPSVDQNALRAYFSVNSVTRSLIQLYSRLLRLTFTQVESDDLLVSDMVKYQVTTEIGVSKGYLCLDLYARPGKVVGCTTVNIRPDVVVLASFSAALSHTEMVDYFREFGNAMRVLYRTPHVVMHNPAYEHMLSILHTLWCWQPDVLLSASDGLPEHTAAAIISAQYTYKSLRDMRRLFLSMFDHTIHNDHDLDVLEIWTSLHEKILQMSTHNTHMCTSFVYAASKRAGLYYSELYHEMLAEDLFARLTVSAEGFPALFAGESLRDTYEFLGRDTNPDAYVARLLAFPAVVQG